MSGFAWVTLATNDSYSLGALVLAHSLRQSGTAHQLAILITPGVTNAMRKNLAEAFNVVEEVNIFDSKDEANLKLLRRPELGVTFTKLNCWRLTQFEKCVFLDADVLVLVNSDELFEREEFSAAPDVGWPDCFNSGVFVYKPSLETYNKLVEFALQRGSFDGGDQGLLNAYFSDWAHKDISKHLPFIYNMCSTASYSYMPAFKYYAATVKIVHFIGPAKPWLQYFDTESRQVHPSPDLQHLQDVLQKWWDIFCSIIHPKLSPEMASSKQSAESLPHPPPSSYAQPGPPPFNHPDSGGDRNYESQQNFSENNVYNVWDPWEEYEESVAVSDTNRHIDYNTEREEPRWPFISEVVSVGHTDCGTTQGTHCDKNHTNEVTGNFNMPEVDRPNFISETKIDQFDNRPVVSSYVETKQYIPPVIHTQNRETENYQSPQPHNASIVDHRLDNFNEPPRHDTYESSSGKDNEPPVRSYPNPDPSLTPRITTQTETLPNMCETSAINSQDASLYTKDNDDAESTSQSGLAGAFAQFTLGVKRSASQDALESHLRRQAWEVGNIDYMGRDSFDNIWSKICQTLSSVQLETGPNKAAAVSSSASQQVPEVAKDSQEIPATIADTPVASEQPQETVAQAEVQADAPKLQEEVSPQPIETQELVTPPASSEVPQLEPEATLVSEVPSQPKLDTIPVSEVPLQPQSQATPVPEIPQPEPEAAPVVTALPGVPQPEPEAAPVVTALPGVPQPEPEAAPVVTALPGVPQPEPEAAPVPTPLPEVPQPEPEVAPVPTPLPEVPQPEPEVAPVPEALKLQEESVPIQTQTVTVPEVPEPQPEPVPLQPEPTPVQEEVQAQSVAAPLQEIPESQPEVPVPVQETPQPQPESVPEVLQSHPEATQEIPQPTQEVPVAVSETAAVQPDVIPKTEEPSPKEEVKVDIPTTQKPAEAVQEAKGSELTQQLVTETPVPVEEPKVEQIEVKSEKAPIPQEVPKSEPKKPVKKVVQESIPPPAELKPVEKPVETPVLKEQSAPVKEEAAPVETKKTVQPHKIVQPSKKSTEKVGAPTKTESPAPATAPKEPESPKVETSPSQESASGEASAEVPKSDTKPKETRKIKKKVKKVPKPESGDAPEGTSKK